MVEIQEDVSGTVKRKNIFQIPCFTLKEGDEQLNEQLRAAILDRYGRVEGNQHSNRGGWQSPYTLHRWPDPGIGRLLSRIEMMVHRAVGATVEHPTPRHYENWLVEAWGNVNVEGARNVSHSHGSPDRPALWSGVYYVQPGLGSGEEEVGGRTVFEDRVGLPRDTIQNDDPSPSEVAVDPEPGQLILFPSTLRHRVEPYWGDDLRITIAFNLYHPGFTIPRYSYREAEKEEKRIYGSRTLWHAGQVVTAAKSMIRRPSALVEKFTPEDDSTQEDDPSEEYDSLYRALRDREGRNVSKLASLTDN